MTTEEYELAVTRMIGRCEAGMRGKYEFLSARRCLRELGYEGPDAEEILRWIADRGFSYCLDPKIPHARPDEGGTSYPPATACEWGADQLESRLRCVL
jgi:hypothetical protein